MGLEAIVRAAKRYWPIVVFCVGSHFAKQAFVNIETEWKKAATKEYITKKTIKRNIQGRPSNIIGHGPDPAWFLSAAYDKGGLVIRYDAATRKNQIVAHCPDGIEDLIVSPDGKHCVIGGSDAIYLTDFSKTQKLRASGRHGSVIGWKNNTQFYVANNFEIGVKEYDIKKNIWKRANFPPVQDAMEWTMVLYLMNATLLSWYMFTRRENKRKGIAEQKPAPSAWYDALPNFCARNPDWVGATGLVAGTAPYLWYIEKYAQHLPFHQIAMFTGMGVATGAMVYSVFRMMAVTCESARIPVLKSIGKLGFSLFGNLEKRAKTIVEVSRWKDEDYYMSQGICALLKRDYDAAFKDFEQSLQMVQTHPKRITSVSIITQDVVDLIDALKLQGDDIPHKISHQFKALFQGDEKKVVQIAQELRQRKNPYINFFQAKMLEEIHIDLAQECFREGMRVFLEEGDPSHFRLKPGSKHEVLKIENKEEWAHSVVILKRENEKEELLRQYVIDSHMYQLHRQFHIPKLIVPRPIGFFDMETFPGGVQEYKKKFYYVLERVPGIPLDEVENKEEWVSLLLDLLPQYQQIATHQPPKGVAPLAYGREFYEKVTKRIFPSEAPEIMDSVQVLLDDLESWPRVFSHHDLNGGNLLVVYHPVTEEPALCILDPEKACMKHPIGDPANAVYHERILLPEKEECIREYTEKNKLNQEHVLPNIFFEVARMGGSAQKYGNAEGLHIHLSRLGEITERLASTYTSLGFLVKRIEKII